jgi:hypothetical protein
LLREAPLRLGGARHGRVAKQAKRDRSALAHDSAYLSRNATLLPAKSVTMSVRVGQ